MTKPAEPQAVPIPDETLTPCPHCKGVGSWAGTSPRGVCGQTITPCSYCAATGLRYPEERIAHLEAQLRDAEITLAKREAMLDEAARLEMQRMQLDGRSVEGAGRSRFTHDECLQLEEALRGENAELEVRLADAARVVKSFRARLATTAWHDDVESLMEECLVAIEDAVARGPVQKEQP